MNTMASGYLLAIAKIGVREVSATIYGPVRRRLDLRQPRERPRRLLRPHGRGGMTVMETSTPTTPALE